MGKKVKISVEELAGGGFVAKISGGFRRKKHIANESLKMLMVKVGQAVEEMISK